MPLLEWQDEYSVGVPDVDFEHQEMIDMINAAHAKLGDPASGLGIDEYLGEIFARISAHFALEERIMRAAGYEEYAAHKDDHEALLDELRDIMDEHAHGGRFDEIILSRTLSDWFGIHFRTFDARLHNKLG